MNDQNSKIGAQSLPMKLPYYSRIGHRVIRVNDQVLILGGIGPSGEFLKTILRFNLQNLKMQPVFNAVCLALEGFSAFTHQGNVYLWGGSLQNKASNSLWRFQDSSFDKCSQNGDVPSPRSFHSSVMVSDKHLLIFGGFNDTEVFNDWYMLNLDTFCWSKVQPNRLLPKNMKFQLVWETGRGYLVSEYQIVKSNCKIDFIQKNYLYEVRIVSFKSNKIRLDLLEDFQGDFFTPRHNFGLVCSDKELWVIGGQISNQSKTESVVCNEVWVLDLITLSWSKKCYNVSAKTAFQIVGYKQKLYLIGGLKSSIEMSASVDIINVRSACLYQSSMCNFCKSVFSLDTKNYFKRHNSAFQIQVKSEIYNLTQISTNFLSKLARSLPNPIQALGLLIDNSLNMGASSISININNPRLSVNYFKGAESFLFVGDNSKSFTTDEITKILFSFRFKVQKYYRDHIDKQDIKMRNEYGLNLKLGSLRLGNSCLFVTTTTDELTFVSYFSDCEIECPQGDPSFNCFYYALNKKGECSSNLNRQIIRENVKHLISEDQFLLTSVFSTKVYVFGLSDIVKIQSTNMKADICYSYLQGVALSSLSQYSSCLYLTPFLGRQLYIQKTRVPFLNLTSKFKQEEKNGLIEQIDTVAETSIFHQVKLYRIYKPSEYWAPFVFIYHQNRLISTVYSKQKTVCGFIEIPDLIEVDFFRSKIERWQEQRKLTVCVQSKQEPRRRQRRPQAYPSNELRKVKSNLAQF